MQNLINSKALEHLNQWTSEKKASPQDLVFLKLLSEPDHLDQINKVALYLKNLRSSFAEGIKILELSTELILMKKTEALFNETESLSSWHQSLKKARYPMTTSRDAAYEKFLLAQPWPFNSKIKFERRGDRPGVEFKYFISDETDLIKVISALERVKENIKGYHEDHLPKEAKSEA